MLQKHAGQLLGNKYYNMNVCIFKKFSRVERCSRIKTDQETEDPALSLVFFFLFFFLHNQEQGCYDSDTVSVQQENNILQQQRLTTVLNNLQLESSIKLGNLCKS